MHNGPFILSTQCDETPYRVVEPVFNVLGELSSWRCMVTGNHLTVYEDDAIGPLPNFIPLKYVDKREQSDELETPEPP
jgi:hypothetical protein